MAIPIKPYDMEYNERFPKNIVIHHSVELDLNVSSLTIDNDSFQTGMLQKHFYRKYNQSTLPYHFVIDYIKDDFYPIISKPLLTKIYYNDIDEEFASAVHIGLLGDYELDTVPDRLYNVLASKVVYPVMRAFRIDINHIYTHHDIAFDQEHTICPGSRFVIKKFKGILRNHIRKVSINRG